MGIHTACAHMGQSIFSEDARESVSAPFIRYPGGSVRGQSDGILFSFSILLFYSLYRFYFLFMGYMNTCSYVYI